MAFKRHEPVMGV